MRTLLQLTAAALALTCTSLYAGTINAGYYFPKDCLEKTAFKPMPKQLAFTCDQNGNCFANDMTLNAILLCAKPFGNTQFNTQTVQSYFLSQTGFVKKQ